MRSQYRLDAFVSSWIITAFGEAVLFAGVIFTLGRQLFESGHGRSRNGWVVLVVVVGHGGGALYGRLGRNLASWLAFGVIYLFSGNLWLVVIACHAPDKQERSGSGSGGHST